MERNSKGSVSGWPIAASPNTDKKVDNGAWKVPLKPMAFQASNDASLFSSSLPVFTHKKLEFTDSQHLGPSLDDTWPKLGKLSLEDVSNDELEVIENNAIGNLLPDDEDELLAGVMEDFDFSRLPSQLEDLDDYDLFGSGGDMELDFETQEKFSVDYVSKLHVSDVVAANGMANFALSNGVGTVSGEHPFGEHPSRTLFVRNINSNIEDHELKALFEQYGDIRTLYTACKHRGFVMISYYDIRSARHAMRALQNKPLRRRKLDIHFSIPKDNPSERDINQGTLVVFNLDPSVSNDDLCQIFGAYGEVKEIRETPHKRHHKFIEYYDVRAADAALKALNRSDIAGKRIKLEPSRPGGARRSLMQQLTHELDQDDTRSFRHQVGSPVSNSPPGTWPQFGSPVELGLKNYSKSPGLGSFSPVNSNGLSGLASVLPVHTPNFGKIAPIGKDQGKTNHINSMFTNAGSTREEHSHSHSYPDQKLSASSGLTSFFGESNSNSSGIETLSGPQFLWGSPTPSSDHSNSSTRPISSAGHLFPSSGRAHGFPHASQHGSFLASHHHVGSAPSGVPVGRPFGFFPESPETSLRSPISYGGFDIFQNSGNYMMNLGAQSAIGTGAGVAGNMTEKGSPSFQMMSLPRHSSSFLADGSYLGPVLNSNEGLYERGRSRRFDNGGNQLDSKKQYQLDLERISSKEDARTTLMIKNIPNKYTSKMLLAAIDEKHRGTYDFLYLPIDFKNKCNVGYAFINMVSPSNIIPFYQAFDGKKWEKFNSEKVASLAYARIQGKAALVTHFQNSSLMNEDKRCRPILFQSEGQDIVDQEPFLSANLNICILQPDGSYSGDSLESPKSGFDEKLEKS